MGTQKTPRNDIRLFIWKLLLLSIASQHKYLAFELINYFMAILMYRKGCVVKISPPSSVLLLLLT